MNPLDHYTGNLTWLPARTIFLCRAGSHAYGTALPTSDQDFRGVAIPPREYFLGYLHRFEQAEIKGNPDVVVYDVRKFVTLAADCNPNIIELLFTDRSDWLVDDHEWYVLHRARDLFLSQKAVHTFTGYAYSQLNRIRSHREHLLHPKEVQPRRADFGLPEGQMALPREQMDIIDSRIRKLADTLAGGGVTKDQVETQHEQDLIAAACRELDVGINLMEVIRAERRYKAAARAYAQYQTWKRERNPKRAELEAKFGYDCKHALHLVRLLRMGCEILAGQGCIVKRPDAEELLAIRAGAWTIDQLLTYADEMQQKIYDLQGTTTLPAAPDRAAIDRLLVDMVGSYLEEYS